MMYPYPSHVNVSSFITVKLGERDMYDMWKTQMKCLLVSHDMLGFINGTFGNPRLSSLGKVKEEEFMLWVRSDALVKGWIIGSLSIHAFRLLIKNINEDFSAKDAWDKLHKMYGPLHSNRQEATTITDLEDKKEMEIREVESPRSRDLISKELYTITKEEKKKKEMEGKERKEKEEIKQDLYNAIVNQNPYKAGFIVTLPRKVQLTDEITNNGNTALHLAVSASNDTKVLNELLKNGLTDVAQLDVRNSEGSTPLHVAAVVGNTNAAMILVEKNKDLLLSKDNEGQIPLGRALSNMHSQTYLYLLDQTKALDREMDIVTTGAHELVVNAISSKDFDSARNLFKIFRPNNSDSILTALAQNFPSALNILEIMAYKISYFSLLSYSFNDYWTRPLIVRGAHCPDYDDPTRPLMYPLFANVWPLKLLLKKAELYFGAVRFLVRICYSMKSGDHDSYYSVRNLIFEATRQNAVQAVQVIIKFFPNAVWSENEDGHNIIQYAVLNRSEKIYNLLYQMSEQKNIYKTVKDSLGNNLLHLAARLAPPNKLNLISGEALQIQSELQWFEEVKKFVCPLNIIQKNSFEETPEMVFTREHRDLVIEGEKWMKATAESYTITAALITTIMFAAAITVPGGNNQDSGFPLFTNKTAFTIFAVSVAISLLSSVTSLVMFLSILTARFAEQDFLFKLPTKLIIGLAALFISTTTMIIAFGVTMFLVFGKSDSTLLVHIVVWSCIPIICFMKFHFPLIADLINVTYGPSIFGKKSDKLFY